MEVERFIRFVEELVRKYGIGYYEIRILRVVMIEVFMSNG